VRDRAAFVHNYLLFGNKFMCDIYVYMYLMTQIYLQFNFLYHEFVCNHSSLYLFGIVIF